MTKTLKYYSSVSDLRSLNRIRSSFQVNNISEICSASGKE